MIVDTGLGCADCFDTCGVGLGNTCGPAPPPGINGNLDDYEVWLDCVNTQAGNASAVYSGLTDAQKFNTFLDLHPADFSTVTRIPTTVPSIAVVPATPNKPITNNDPAIQKVMDEVMAGTKTVADLQKAINASLAKPTPSNDPVATVKQTVSTTVENVGAKVNDLISPVVTNPISNSSTGYLAFGVIALIAYKVLKGS